MYYKFVSVNGSFLHTVLYVLSLPSGCFGFNTELVVQKKNKHTIIHTHINTLRQLRVNSVNLVLPNPVCGLNNKIEVPEKTQQMRSNIYNVLTVTAALWLVFVFQQNNVLFSVLFSVETCFKKCLISFNWMFLLHYHSFLPHFQALTRISELWVGPTSSLMSSQLFY